MGLEEMTFVKSGPAHMMIRSGDGSSLIEMKEIHWDSEEHRRCIAACIVRGVYIMEKEREKSMTENKLAPAWWESFHFRCCEVLKDRKGFIFGAIFGYAPPDGAWRHPSAPRYVVAFRGTMLRQSTRFADMHHNLKIALNEQHESGRYRDARHAVAELLDGIACARVPAGIVWLAGHSLGASIALDVGRSMMDERRWCLPTFLFNPPHVSVAPVINMLGMAEEARRNLYFTSVMVKATLAMTVRRPHERSMTELFERLAPWVPNLYVHQRDLICQGFADYFEQRQKMLEQPGPFRSVAEVAMKLSYRDMLTSSSHDANAENGDEPRVQPHLLPSAMLWKNSSCCDRPHKLKHWWLPDSVLNLRLRQYIHLGP